MVAHLNYTDTTFTSERKLLFSYSLIYWSIHEFILFDGTNRICVCKSIKTTKLVQASTIACSSSAMLDQHGSTRSSRLARQSRTCRVESRRAKWNLGLYDAMFFGEVLKNFRVNLRLRGQKLCVLAPIQTSLYV